VQVSGDTHTGSGSVAFTVAASSQTTPRTATLVVAAQNVAVSQEAAATSPPQTCDFTLTAQPTDLDLAGGNGQVTIGTRAGCAWTLKQDDSWISLAGPQQGSGPATVPFTWPVNDTAPARAEMLSIAAVSVRLTQPGQGGCSYQVAPVYPVLATADSHGTVSIATSPGCLWSASSNVPWLRPDTASGMGASTLGFGLDPNSPAVYRTATLALRWLAPTAGQNVFVTQNGPPGQCSIAYSGRDGATNPLTVGPGGGQFRYYVLSDPFMTCGWAVENSDDWVVINFPANRQGNGDGDLTFTVAPNPSASSRKSSIVINGSALTITQLGR
jgi:hypothetical protein